MSVQLWPPSLPQRPTIAGFGETARSSKVSFQPDQGPPIERPRNTVRIATFNASFVMSNEQVETFEQFVHATLAEASLEFYIPHPRTGEQAKAKIAGGNQAYGIQWHSKDKWRVTVPLMVIG